MMQPSATINYLPSFLEAKARDEVPPLRTCDEDGTHHWSQLKRLADSGVQYLHAVNSPFDPTPPMLLGTGVHVQVLGERPGAPVHVYPGKTRQGKAWEEFAAAHADGDILTASEWERAKVIGDAVKASSVARPYLDGARLEVPLAWEEDGLKFSTSGVDILPARKLGDLKTTGSTELEVLMRQCFRFSYHGQLAFYRRGATANGIDTSEGLFLICVETKAPYEVVVLELSEDLIDLADRTVTLMIEKLRAYRDADQWPPRAQTPVVWSVPAWMQSGDDDGEETEA